MKTRLPGQKNPSLLDQNIAAPHLHSGKRELVNAARLVIAEEGWDVLDTTLGLIRARYTALAAAPTKMGGDVPILNDLAPKVGRKLSVITPQYDGFPIGALTYQWTQDASTDIGGATSKDYIPVTGDIGHTLKCKVTSTNGTGAINDTSVASAAVVA